MKKFKIKNNISLFLIISLLLNGCVLQTENGQDSAEVSETLYGPLDTISTISLYEWNGGKEPIDEVFGMLEDIDKRMSAVSEESEITALSKTTNTPYAASDDIFKLLLYAKRISSETDGAFDITIRPVMNLWKIGTEYAQIPDSQELNSALSYVGHENIILDESSSEVLLTKEGMMLDLGGIAKGYACDLAVGILEQAGVEHAIINLGSNIYVHGNRPDGTPWRVGIKIPFSGDTGYFGIVNVVDRSIVTSGVYERFFEKEDRIYHHIMNPKTGYPVDNGLLSVTVVSESSMEADALSTACFVLGKDKGLEYLSTLQGAEGIFVLEDLSVYITPGLKDIFQITDERFSLSN